MKRTIAKLAIVLAYIAIYFTAQFTHIYCIWKFFFKMPCPGCGFTRALAAAVRLDFAKAFYYHPMFWSFPLIVVFFLFGERIKSKKFEYIMLSVAVMFFIVWIVRLILGVDV